MAYTRTTWNPEAPPGISADALNNIEQGIVDAHGIAGRLQGSDGSILSGSGFTVNRAGVGDYTITFASAFASVPLVFCQVIEAAGLGYVAVVQTLAVDSVRVRVVDPTVGAVDSDLAFYAREA